MSSPQPNPQLIVIDCTDGLYVLDTAGYFTHVQTLRRYAFRMPPRTFARRVHAWQWLHTRPAGWFLSLPPTPYRFPVRVLSARTVGL